MENSTHARANGLIVDVEGAGVLRSSSSPMLLGGGKQGFNGFLAENDQRRDCSSPLGNGFVSCGLTYPTDDLFPASFFRS